MLEAGTKNAGILEAIKEVRVMSLGKTLRLMYEARLKEIRDRDAREDYVRNEGIELGRNEGLSQGEDRMNRLVICLIENGRQDDIEKAARDKQYREQLYKEYDIK